MGSYTNQPINIVRAISLGAITGFIVAMLVAPRKGSETRAQLQERYNTMKEKARSKKDAATEKLNENKENMKNTTQDIAKRANNAIGSTQSQAGTASEGARQRPQQK